MSIITVDNKPEVTPTITPPAAVVDQPPVVKPMITEPVGTVFRIQGSLAESVAVELANRLNDNGVEAKVTTESMMTFVSVADTTFTNKYQSPTNVFAITSSEVTDQAQGDVIDNFSKIAQDNDVVIVPNLKRETDDGNIRKLVVAEHAVLSYSKKKYFYTASAAITHLLGKYGY